MCVEISSILSSISGKTTKYYDSIIVNGILFRLIYKL